MGTLYKEIYNAIKDVIEDKNEVHSIIIMIMKYIYKTDVVQDITTEREYNFECLNNIRQRLSNDEPIQYILGKCNFYGYDFFIDSRALIPRPETEELFYHLKDISLKKYPYVLDICTGSGCIAITFGLEYQNSIIWATDVSHEAIELAKKNSQYHNVNVNFLCEDMFNMNLNEDIKFDIIISNPPYILKTDIDTISPRVKNYEPHLALFVDNFAPFYEAIAKIGNKYLNKNGYIFVEINEKFSNEICNIFSNLSYKVSIYKDFYNKNRWIMSQKL